MVNNQIKIEIKKAHDNYITNFRHYQDNIQKRDLIISISREDNQIKLWNVNNFELLVTINNINKNGNLDSACFLNYQNQIYIVSSNGNLFFEPELIKIFGLNGNKIKEINNSNDNTSFIDTYYDIHLNKHYIITGNDDRNIKSYDYNYNKIYQNYRTKTILNIQV